MDINEIKERYFSKIDGIYSASKPILLITFLFAISAILDILLGIKWEYLSYPFLFSFIHKIVYMLSGIIIYKHIK